MKNFFARFRRDPDSLTAKCRQCDKVGLKTEMHHEGSYGYFCNWEEFWEHYTGEIW